MCNCVLEWWGGEGDGIGRVGEHTKSGEVVNVCVPENAEADKVWRRVV